ncbi:MAG: hypothetical protein ABFD86_15315 [Bryobacteraceae bacterium]
MPDAASLLASIPSLEECAAELRKRRSDSARKSFRAFVEQAWHVLEPGTEFVPGIHVDAICEHLQAVIEGRIKDIVINNPPGHAKSLLTCVFWPAWAWIDHPELRWLFSSYRADLAIRDSVKCRTLIESDWYQKRWGKKFSLQEDQNEKRRFQNDKTGYRAITSVGTGTGERGDIVCLPHDALISTTDGQIAIGEIVDRKLDVGVLGYDHQRGEVVVNRIEDYEVNPARELVEIEIGDRRLVCTEDHPVWVEGRGYIPAGTVRVGDEVLLEMPEAVPDKAGAQ